MGNALFDQWYTYKGFDLRLIPPLVKLALQILSILFSLLVPENIHMEYRQADRQTYRHSESYRELRQDRKRHAQTD